MSDLALDCCAPEFPADQASATGTTGVAAFRTVFAGTLSRSDRAAIGSFLISGGETRKHLVAPAVPGTCPDDQAVHLLLQDAVDVVMLDLDGPVGTMLSLVGQLRAAARAHVVFVGILPSDSGSRESRYLSAVVDSVVERPLRACRLHAAVAEALQSAVDSQDIDYGRVLSGLQSRH